MKKCKRKLRQHTFNLGDFHVLEPKDTTAIDRELWSGATTLTRRCTIYATWLVQSWSQLYISVVVMVVAVVVSVW